MELRVCVWPQHGVTPGPLWVQVSAWNRICISPGNHTWLGLVHLSVPGATSGPCSGIAGWFCPKEDPKSSIDAVWMLSRRGQRMTWRTELSLGADVQNAWDCPELLQGSKRAEVSAAEAVERAQVPSSALSQAERSCSTGSGPAHPPLGISSTFRL